MKKRRFELLAPAGDEECLRAAVANGADAVYFGLEDFNARRRAENFALASLPATMEWLHRRNVKGYVAFNTLVFSDELDRAADYVRQIIEAGADALIVQDLGIASLIRRMSATFPIHASTQTTQTHAEGIALLADLGVSRVILARELSLDDIGCVAAATEMELEAFVHGALCVSYSGQCLASESLWGRSGNRGVCGQACRLPYRLIVDGREQPARDGDYLLSPRDLAAWSRIPELMRAGVSSCKIEGRLKGAPYVAAVVRIYREAMDAAIRGEPYVLAPQREEELAQSFSRGFTCGFLDGPRHQELIGARSPKGRGLRVGTVVGRTRQSITVRIEAPGRTGLKPGDGVVFDRGSGEDDEQGGRIYSVSRPSDKERVLVELTFGRGDLDPRKVAIGSEVFKTDDPAVARRIESTCRREEVARPVAVTARVSAAVGEPMRLMLGDEDGHEVQVHSTEPLSAARRHPLTLDLLREQLSRLGDTPFVLTAVELVTVNGPAESVPVMAPKSVLNQLRRSAAQALLDMRLRAARHWVDVGDALPVIRRQAAVRADLVSSAARRVHVLVRDLDQLAAMAESAATVPNLDIIYADLSEPREYKQATTIAVQAGIRVGLATPRVIQPGEEYLLEAIARAQPSCVLVRNLTALRYLRRQLPGAEMVGDFSLNVANEITASVMGGWGLARMTLAYDLNLGQMQTLLDRAAGLAFELIVHAHVPMFLTAHCPAAAGLSDGNTCRDCSRDCVRHELGLRDRNGEEHPLRVEAGGRSVIFNSIPQSIVPVWARVAGMSIADWRVELLGESTVEARQLLGWYSRLAAGDEAVLVEWREKNTRARAGTLEHA